MPFRRAEIVAERSASCVTPGRGSSKITRGSIRARGGRDESQTFVDAAARRAVRRVRGLGLRGTMSLDMNYSPALYRLQQADQWRGIALGLAKPEDPRRWNRP